MSDIQNRIKGLIDEEHGLRTRLSKGEITVDEENRRLRRIEVELDQCWDLLRQRAPGSDATPGTSQ